MTEATKRPWKLILPVLEEEGEETEEGGMVGVIMGDRIDSPGNYTVGNEIKLDENCSPGDNEVAEANARLIVKAVNCHDELVEALKGMTDVCFDYLTYKEQAEVRKYFNKSEQALSKAQEERCQ